MGVYSDPVRYVHKLLYWVPCRETIGVKCSSCSHGNVVDIEHIPYATGEVRVPCDRCTYEPVVMVFDRIAFLNKALKIIAARCREVDDCLDPLPLALRIRDAKSME